MEPKWAFQFLLLPIWPVYPVSQINFSLIGFLLLALVFYQLLSIFPFVTQISVCFTLFLSLSLSLSLSLLFVCNCSFINALKDCFFIFFSLFCTLSSPLPFCFVFFLFRSSPSPHRDQADVETIETQEQCCKPFLMYLNSD